MIGEPTESRPVFVSWSGGKESCLAAYRAARQGLRVSHLLNMIDEDTQRSCFHGVRADLIEAQSTALEISILQRRATMGTYEKEFKAALRELRSLGVEAGVFGDIDVDEHREWVRQVCQETAIEPLLPLWGSDQLQLLHEFIACGFDAIVVATRAKLFGEKWVGRKLNSLFVDHLLALQAESHLSLCGEAGEYHTLVLDGPLFTKRVEIVESTKVTMGSYHFLEVLKYELKGKRGE